ncbi:hypothetical protein AZE42_10306, partial [Rhizopogon vesiculosus]
HCASQRGGFGALFSQRAGAWCPSCSTKGLGPLRATLVARVGGWLYDPGIEDTALNAFALCLFHNTRAFFTKDIFHLHQFISGLRVISDQCATVGHQAGTEFVCCPLFYFVNPPSRWHQLPHQHLLCQKNIFRIYAIMIVRTF